MKMCTMRHLCNSNYLIIKGGNFNIAKTFQCLTMNEIVYILVCTKSSKSSVCHAVRLYLD